MDFRYIAFNKPYGVLSQFTREPGSDWGCLRDFKLPPHVYPAGRLDADSEGLLLLTDDGWFAHKLLQPKFHHPRVYWAQVEGVPNAEAMDRLRSGLKLRDYQTLPCKAWILDPPPKLWERNPPIRHREEIPTTWIELTLIEGKNRQVRRMTAMVGHPTLRLVRSAIGRLRIGPMQPGEWREVKPEDIWRFSPQPQMGYGGPRRLAGKGAPRDERGDRPREYTARSVRPPRPPRPGEPEVPPQEEIVEFRVKTDDAETGQLKRRRRP
jgi:23S rRNA pseudouridine2457 synthase